MYLTSLLVFHLPVYQEMLAKGEGGDGYYSDEESVAHGFFQFSFYGANVERRGEEGKTEGQCGLR
jgi:hypothetical protein